MRIELVFILITASVMANIYTDGKYLTKLLSYKKYYKMGGVAFGAFVLYWMIKKKPERTREMINTSHEYLKYLPIDKDTSNVLSPILDFTSNQNFSSDLGTGTAAAGGSYGIMNMLMPGQDYSHQEARLMKSGKTGTKRSVSETKKKFVAAQQNWTCGDCKEQLSAWFEVDHKVRLEYGGSNHIDNLVALCRECHGKKTAIENL